MNIEERFLEYVKINTQSDPTSKTTPSSACQLDLANLLVQQLHDLGICNAHLDEYGIVYASIEANESNLDKIGFLAHMDTSPDASGKDVKPQIIRNYNGEIITLNENNNFVLDPNIFPSLNTVIGHDLVTTDGTTLLGADDKAGIAIIMDMLQYVTTHPEYKHGRISIAFTPDEEIGGGIDQFNVEKFDVDYAYTIDGGSINKVGYENFNAYGATIKITGRSVHPGDAKNEMINASLVAMEFEAMLPVDQKPQYTSGYEGFFHLHEISGSCNEASMEYIIRNHDLQLAKKQVEQLKNIMTFLNQKYGYEICQLDIEQQYLNMYEVLKNDLTPVNRLFEAFKTLNIPASREAIRGGTDGARLTFMGIPCPNIGTGGFNFHGNYEYASLTMMQQVSQLLLEIIK